VKRWSWVTVGDKEFRQGCTVNQRPNYSAVIVIDVVEYETFSPVSTKPIRKEFCEFVFFIDNDLRTITDMYVPNAHFEFLPLKQIPINLETRATLLSD
jgi:hypothetical protein